MLVHQDIDQAVGDLLVNRDLGIRSQPGDVLRRHGIDQVDIPGQEGRHARAGVLDQLEGHLFPGQGAGPVVVVAQQLDRVVRQKARQLVGARSDGELAVVEVVVVGLFGDMGRRDRDPAHAEGKERNRLLADHPEPVVGGGDDLGDTCEVMCEGGGAARHFLARALQGRDGVQGAQFRSRRET